MYLQDERRLGDGGLGLCVVPKKVEIRKLVCTDADMNAIGAEMGKGRGLVIREVRTAIEDAAIHAVRMIERAESQLKMPRATGQAGVAIRERFRDAFGRNPEFVPDFRPAGQTWDIGAVVRERLRCAAKIMSEGGIEFVAWGPLSCPFAFDWTTRPWAVVQGGVSRICLGQTFWHAAGEADSGGMATTLLHECLHIFFDTMHHHGLERWAFNTPACYERYVLLCNGYPIPADVNTPCPSKIPGAPVAVKSSPMRRFGIGLGDPPDRFKKGGLPVGEDDAKHLLTILAGKSSYRPYLARAMKGRATTLPKRFFRVVTSVSSQVPKRLQHVFTSGGGRMTGGTIDRWTRTVYVVPPPGLRNETRLEYAIHECVHLFAHPHAPTQQQCPDPCIGTFQHEFGTGFGEGLTQVITEDIMEAQGISKYYRDRPYDDFAEVMREVVKVFGLDAMARAYFFGDVKSLRTSMEFRWGTNWHAVAGATSSGDKTVALERIRQLEQAHRQRIEDLIRQSPKGDFPAPGSRVRSMA